jgi:hypothetical protein
MILSVALWWQQEFINVLLSEELGLEEFIFVLSPRE